MQSVTPTLDPLLAEERKTNVPAKKAKWHLGEFYRHSKVLLFLICKRQPRQRLLIVKILIFVLIY